MKTKTLAIAGGALAAALLLGAMLLYDNHPKCDAPETVATLKRLALERINGTGGRALLGHLKEMAGNTYPGHVTLSLFRKRGDVGAGSSCAALVSVRASPNDYSTADILADYTIEPTTDGGAVVTGNFVPN